MGLFSSCLPLLHPVGGRRASRKAVALAADVEVESTFSRTPTLRENADADGEKIKDLCGLGSPLRTEVNHTGPQLTALRSLLAEQGVAWFVVLSEDQHASEYTSPSDQRRAFVSGFTGSVGVALVGTDSAHLFADGRYWVQAARQLDENWTLHKVGAPGVKSWDQWLLEQIRSKDKVGLNPKFLSYRM